jgi:hypothetical protein
MTVQNQGAMDTWSWIKMPEYQSANQRETAVVLTLSELNAIHNWYRAHHAFGTSMCHSNVKICHSAKNKIVEAIKAIEAQRHKHGQ